MKELKHFRLDFRTVENLSKDELSDLIDAARIYARTGDADAVAHLLTSPAVAAEFKIYEKRIARQLHRAANPVPRKKKPVAEPEPAVTSTATNTLPKHVLACTAFTADGIMSAKHALEHCRYNVGYNALLRLVSAVEQTITPLMPPIAESELLAANMGDTEAMYDAACRYADHFSMENFDRAEMWFERFATLTGEDMSLKLADLDRRRRSFAEDHPDKSTKERGNAGTQRPVDCSARATMSPTDGWSGATPSGTVNSTGE